GVPPSTGGEPLRGSPESFISEGRFAEAGFAPSNASTDHSPPIRGIPARQELRTMSSADAAANWMCGPRGMPRPLVQRFATLRTEANMNPPVSGPDVAGADTQSESSVTLDARFHGCQCPFARRALSVGLIVRRARATAGRGPESNA